MMQALAGENVGATLVVARAGIVQAPDRGRSLAREAMVNVNDPPRYLVWR